MSSQAFIQAREKGREGQPDYERTLRLALMGLHGQERVKVRKHIYYQCNKERIDKRVSKWKRKNYDKVREYWKVKYTRHADQVRAYRESTKEQRREWKRVYYQKNKKKIDTQNKEWRLKNLDAWRVLNAAGCRRRQYRLRGAIGSHTTKEWENLKRIYDSTCPKCLRSEPFIKLTEDHKIPLSLGGSNNIDNIQPLCTSCNSAKRNKIWFASLPINYKQNVHAAVLA
jgi:5-methylcytosine-specific restriction endonuclease McrA